MKTILILGAGRSASSLINYLCEHANDASWKILLGDYQLALAEEKIKKYQGVATAFQFDINNEEHKQKYIPQADIIVSMLPARFHIEVAKIAVENGIPMTTASYITEEMQALNEQAKEKGIILLNEIGLDPGIDHMSAMKMIEEVKEKGNKIEGFESFTGGLMAPESDNNPWNYKFTWNPRNVVIAGQGGAVRFLHNGKYKYIPYHKLFRRTERIEIDHYGSFEGYANRDSLKYVEKYGLEGVPTVYRGTLRRPGFCRAWNCFVMLGATDDSYVMEDTEDMTYREFINSFLRYNPQDSVELKLMQYLKLSQDDLEMDKLRWLDIFSDKKVGLKSATPAQILQKILEEKWKLEKEDKDMIVMYHKLFYQSGDENIMRTSHMVVKGKDQTFTAMSDTVGIPLAIATKLILEGKITKTGTCIPVHKNIYEPVLEELKQHGIEFVEKEVKMSPSELSSL
ncbi:saccharopine dehydrogenase [Flammeovirga sp. MY04]|uniref:saccharopine dehydrogenase C-terminal domain-containing protein n=1 Tax=Flammeovirga sp. MY04 TaxID=1191459 RepID=UPI0008061EFF|nr:saccharopine dehydrogenase C-terminal domain-containing protein [Flammeovirga sp. MY04]ANQ50663.1 saccharopine dehydrogenase [Flammeovirga sp. MY04]